MLVRAIAAAVIASATAHHVFAAEPSGQAVAVIQSAAVQGAAGSRALEVRGPVFSGDVVKTNRRGEAQLKFRDGTRLVVGPQSELTIDRFVLADQSNVREMTINAVRGAFRFISGSSRKQSYSINTPTATIGVRGTAFDVSVVDDVTYLALFDGGVRMCRKSGPEPRCANLEGRCRVLVLGPEGDFRWVRNLVERTELMDTVFRYAFRQRGLRSEFRVSSRGCAYREFRRRGRHSTEEPGDRPDRDRGSPNDNPDIN